VYRWDSVLAKIGPAIIIMLCGFSGVTLAFIEKTLYDNGVLVTALSIMGVTLTEAMTITVVTWLLVGSIIGLLKA